MAPTTPTPPERPADSDVATRESRSERGLPERCQVEIFESFEEENRAERERRATMTPEDRLRELAVLRARHWGESWAEKPIEKVATWEWVSR